MKKLRRKNVRYLDQFLDLKHRALGVVNKLIPAYSLIVLLTIVYEIGFEQHDAEFFSIIDFYLVSSVLFFLAYALRLFVFLFGTREKKWIYSDLIIFICLSLIILVHFFPLEIPLPFLLSEALSSLVFIYIVFSAIFFIEASKISLNFNKRIIEPPLIYAGSFILLITIGTGLLLLPAATVNGITLLDALFTSTSAVCVTGLIVVDTSSHFTLFGQIVILALFQAGGLGVMTFTSFFGFFFRGSFTFENQIFMRDFINEEKMGQIFRTLFKIIFFTLAVELVGALLIYLLLDSSIIQGQGEQIFFSIFHAVSAFCNAGFSTLSDGLYEEGIRDQYHIHLVVAILIIFGGLGFPIILNFFKYIKYLVISRFRHFTTQLPVEHKTRIINVNSKIVIYTTAILLVSGFAIYYVSEYNHTLAGLSTYGKIVTAFFGSVTPRTAGFNTVDMSGLATPTILIYLLLMWIGASPGSTGGGIKTTTFSVAVLNTFSLGKAKNRVEAFRREISTESLRRAFAVMVLSFLVIGLAVFLVTTFDPEKELMAVAFECFSAFSTVGLSLGITGDLSAASKVVIIFTMYLGRVGTLTILVGLIRNINTLNYRYPSESIFIN